jgi:hypothetical protein
VLKKIIFLAVLLALVGLIGVALVARKLPDLAVRNLRQTLGRDVAIGSLKVRFPLRLEMNRLTVSENEPFKGETAFQVEQAVASVDAWELLTERKVRFTDVELIRPQLTFRKSLGKVYHAFRVRSTLPAGPVGAGSNAPGTAAPGIPPLRFERVTIRDGRVQFMDYDADRKGFVITLLRLSAELEDLALPSDGSRLRFDIEALLDQGRDTPAGRLKLKGHWRRESLEGETNLTLQGIHLPFFEPYYRTVTPSRISDGELDLVASAKSPHAILTAHSKWTLRRLAFDKTEAGNELFGFDANLIQGILAGDDGILHLDLELNMDLRDRSTPFREVLLQSLRRSIKATFLSNFDSAVKSTVEKITEKAPSLLQGTSWKDLLKKNKRQDILNAVMDPS